MNKRGITLVELIAVLVIIGLIATIVLPNINKIIKDSKDTTENVQESEIIEAAKSYLADNIEDSISFDNNQTATVSLDQLLTGGYLSREPKDLNTGEDYDLANSKVTIKKEGNKYTYTVSLIIESLEADTD